MLLFSGIIERISVIMKWLLANGIWHFVSSKKNDRELKTLDRCTFFRVTRTKICDGRQW